MGLGGEEKEGREGGRAPKEERLWLLAANMPVPLWLPLSSTDGSARWGRVAGGCAGVGKHWA